MLNKCWKNDFALRGGDQQKLHQVTDIPIESHHRDHVLVRIFSIPSCICSPILSSGDQTEKWSRNTRLARSRTGMGRGSWPPDGLMFLASCFFVTWLLRRYLLSSLGGTCFRLLSSLDATCPRIPFPPRRYFSSNTFPPSALPVLEFLSPHGATCPRTPFLPRRYLSSNCCPPSAPLVLELLSSHGATCLRLLSSLGVTVPVYFPPSAPLIYFFSQLMGAPLSESEAG